MPVSLAGWIYCIVTLEISYVISVCWSVLPAIWDLGMSCQLQMQTAKIGKKITRLVPSLASLAK